MLAWTLWSSSGYRRLWWVDPSQAAALAFAAASGDAARLVLMMSRAG
jgi:hypothetical protein